MGARQTNYGSRVDYILFDKSLVGLFIEKDKSIADIMPHIKGSDHCPVWAKVPLSISANEAGSLPPLCSHFWPQCQKRQLTLSQFLKSRDEIERKEPAGGGALNTQVSEAPGGKRIRQARLDFGKFPALFNYWRTIRRLEGFLYFEFKFMCYCLGKDYLL